MNEHPLVLGPEIEAVARAMCEAQSNDPDVLTGMLARWPQWKDYKIMAEAAIKTYTEYVMHDDVEAMICDLEAYAGNCSSFHLESLLREAVGYLERATVARHIGSGAE